RRSCCVIWEHRSVGCGGARPDNLGSTFGCRAMRGSTSRVHEGDRAAPTYPPQALQEQTMTTRQGITRRQYLSASGAGALTLGLAVPARGQAGIIRQGYQTNVWGMPTYYLLRSGALEKRGLKFEEFGVP